jgi:hypothetical protein
MIWLVFVDLTERHQWSTCAAHALPQTQMAITHRHGIPVVSIFLDGLSPWSRSWLRVRFDPLPGVRRAEGEPEFDGLAILREAAAQKAGLISRSSNDRVRLIVLWPCNLDAVIIEEDGGRGRSAKIVGFVVVAVDVAVAAAIVAGCAEEGHGANLTRHAHRSLK